MTCPNAFVSVMRFSRVVQPVAAKWAGPVGLDVTDRVVVGAFDEVIAVGRDVAVRGEIQTIRL